VFYDYDEICYLTDVKFRRMPPPRDDAEELSGEPWFFVGPADVFPEEFPTFLFSPGRQRELFLELNRDLVDAGWWTRQQESIRGGAQPDLFPYPDETRFLVRYGAQNGARHRAPPSP
jgi:isocitrate dehydrogenase kinase/phosphatase